jgi:hypothetical protein
MCGCRSDSDVAVAEGLYGGGVWRDAVKSGNDTSVSVCVRDGVSDILAAPQSDPY